MNKVNINHIAGIQQVNLVYNVLPLEYRQITIRIKIVYSSEFKILLNGPVLYIKALKQGRYTTA
jgi:hypothetical protein